MSGYISQHDRPNQDKEFPSSYHGSFTRGCRYGYEQDKHSRSMSSRFNEEYKQRRDHDKRHEEFMSGSSSDSIRVEWCDFHPLDNAREHRTDMYEIVYHEPSRAVFRRGMTFRMTIKFQDRNFNPDADNVRLVFNFGPNPSVPKETRVVLPLTSQGDMRDKLNNWEARVQGLDRCSIDVEVYVPPNAPVGVWRCWVETCPDGFSYGRRDESLHHRDNNHYDRRSSSPFGRRDSRSDSQTWQNRRNERNDSQFRRDDSPYSRRSSPYRRSGSWHGEDRWNSNYNRWDHSPRRYSGSYYRNGRHYDKNNNDYDQREYNRSGNYRHGSSYCRNESPYRQNKINYNRDASPHRYNSSSYRRDGSPYSHRWENSSHHRPLHSSEGSRRRSNSFDNHYDYRYRKDGSPFRRNNSSYERDGSFNRRYSSVRQRHSSPYGRDGSPYRRDGSPYRRDGSPYRRDGSPYHRDESFYYRDGNQYHRDGIRHHRDGSYYSRDRSNYRRDARDYHKDTSPYRRDGSPYRKDESFNRRDGSPYGRDGSPYRRDGSPYRRDGSPYRRDGSSYNRDEGHYHRYRNSYYRDGYGNRQAYSDNYNDRSYYGDRSFGRNRDYYGYNHENKEVFKCKQDIYILFNSWCRDDPTYMEDDMWRNEYVLNDTGKIWVGTYKKYKGRRWVYGQFDDVVLPAVMYLLEEAKLSGTERANPIRVVRAISEMVNSKDFNSGVMEKKWQGHHNKSLMVGRYDGHYDDGVSPFSWTGSVRILEQYLRTGKPVKYGHCWVFAGVTTTICRALGIPCRPVTNFVSAHDTNNTLSIDKYFSCSGDEIEGGPDGESWDSIWNFHSWNDAWMARPDLPSGYGGWQAIDSTFQEESDGRYKCGPSSLESIRRGEVGFCYDTPFIFTEVNAEVNHWQEDEESDWGYTRMRNGRYHVGRQIITKRPDRDDDEGDEDVEDITYEYKPKSVSFKEYHNERDDVMNTLQGMERGKFSRQYHYKGVDDVEFELMEPERVRFGQPFTVSMSMVNRSNDTRSIDAMLSCNSVFYTGVKNRRIKHCNDRFVLHPNERQIMEIRITPEEYHDKMVDFSMIKIYGVANVKETRQNWGEEDDFYFDNPKLNIQTRGNNRVNEDMEVSFSFTNPLDITLTNCRFNFEGPGLQRPKYVKIRDVRPGEMVGHVERFFPTQPGNSKIVVNFTSHQLTDVNGSRNVTIRN